MSRKRKLEVAVARAAAELREIRAALTRTRRAEEFARAGPARRSAVWLLLRLCLDLAGTSEERAILLNHLAGERRGRHQLRLRGRLDAEAPEAPWNAVVHVEAALRHARAEAQSRLVHRAARLVAEARAALRMARANSRGSSPGAREVASWLAEAWPETERRGFSCAYLARLGSPPSRAGCLYRFRRRWAVRLAIMPWRSALPAELAARKVFRAETGAGT
jgi:hypothetical protein